MTAPTTQRRDELDARLREYHQQGLDDVLELLDYLRSPGDSVIAGGSLSIGLGNRLSDVDMVIVGEATNTSVVPLQHWVGGLRVDAWTRSVGAVDALFAEAEAALAAPQPLLRTFGNTEQEQQLKLLHRIAFGVVIDGDPVQPATARPAQQTAADLLTREYAERLRESALIAQLAERAGRARTAAFSARQAVEEALHAALHAGGVPFSGDKWLQEQLGAAPELAGLHARFLDLPREPAEVGAFVAEALATAEALLGLELSLTALTAQLSWTLRPDLALLPLSGEQVLVEPSAGAAWTLDAADADAWQELGLGDGDARVPHPARAAAEGLCLRLHERGLATPAWPSGVAVSSLTITQEVQ